MTAEPVPAASGPEKCPLANSKLEQKLQSFLEGVNDHEPAADA